MKIKDGFVFGKILGMNYAMLTGKNIKEFNGLLIKRGWQKHDLGEPFQWRSDDTPEFPEEFIVCC